MGLIWNTEANQNRDTAGIMPVCSIVQAVMQNGYAGSLGPMYRYTPLEHIFQ